MKTENPIAGRIGGPLTWDHLTTKEPRLVELLAEVRHLKRSRRRANWSEVWYREIKPRMTKLVGWGRDAEDWLCGSEAYDTAYRTLHQALTGK